MEYKVAVAVVALIAALFGVYLTGYMIDDHGTDHLVKLVIAQETGEGLPAAILAAPLLR